MTKVTMPEHWAERIAEGKAVDFWWQNGTKGIKVGEKLITTAQAEAYADARVREALLEAYGSMQDMHMSLLNDATPYVHPAQVASFAANRISALIPKEDI